MAILPVKASQWPFEKWASDPEFSSYVFVENGVKYRGLTFQNGDILLSNLHGPTDGLYTSFMDPVGYLAHFALFTLFEKDHGFFPAVIEIHEHGIRAVPLSVFLSGSFTEYVEIYRVRNPSAGWVQDLPKLTSAILKEPHAYDFCSQDEDRKYLSCSSVGSLFFERMGMKPIVAKALFPAGVAKNLSQFDMTFSEILTPTDYATDPRLELVGTLSQGR